jgi:hypothetical protein
VASDLDLVRTMRSDAPIPSRERLGAGREQLLAAIDSSPRHTVRAGRRLAGVRGWLLAGGAVAVAVAVALVALVAQRELRPATLHGSPAAKSAKYTDPLVERAAFGWLPPGLRANRYIADHQHASFFEVTANNEKTGANVVLTAYERGKEPFLGYLPGGVPAKRIPAPPVNGHAAYWLYTPNPSGQSSFELRWEYAPNRWADLTAGELTGTSAKLTSTAYKIAKSAKFGGTRPIAMPLHVDGVPGGLTPKRTVLNTGAHDELSAIVSFIVTVPSDELSISIVKSNGAIGTGRPGGTGYPRPNTTLDGHPAYLTPGSVHVYGVNGFDVDIGASGSVLAKLNKTGGVARLFHRLTVLGTDQSNWTTNPVN